MIIYRSVIIIRARIKVPLVTYNALIAFCETIWTMTRNEQLAIVFIRQVN